MTTTHEGLSALRTTSPEFMAGWDAEVREVYKCPEWCQEDPHLHAVSMRLDGRPVVDHGGPDFEFFLASGETYAESGEVSRVSVAARLDDPSAYLSIEQLRQMAAEALQAAEWLEDRA